MKKFGKIVILLFLLLLIFTNGCATYIRFPLRKPSENDPGSIKKIYVNDFVFQGDWRNDDRTGNLLTELGNLALDLLKEQIGLSTDSEQALQAGKKLKADLIYRLRQNGYYQVVNFSNKKDLNAENTDGIISGSVLYDINDRGNWREEVKTNPQNNTVIRNRRFSASREINVYVNINLTKSSGGEVLSAFSFEERINEFSEGETPEKAFVNFPDWKKQIYQLTEPLLDEVVRKIAPHYEDQEREIKDGELAQMKKALEYAKNGVWSNAVDLWREVLDTEQKSDDQAKALYNLGIYSEMMDLLPEAKKYFSDCYQLKGFNECLEGQRRIEVREIELNKLKNQEREKKN